MITHVGGIPTPDVSSFKSTLARAQKKAVALDEKSIQVDCVFSGSGTAGSGRGFALIPSR